MSEAHEKTRIRQLEDAAAHWEHKYANARQYNRNLEERIRVLEAALRFYIDAFPAFRSKPVGAPESIERQAQDVHIAEEDKARRLLGTASETPDEPMKEVDWTQGRTCGTADCTNECAPFSIRCAYHSRLNTVPTTRCEACEGSGETGHTHTDGTQYSDRNPPCVECNGTGVRTLTGDVAK